MQQLLSKDKIKNYRVGAYQSVRLIEFRKLVLLFRSPGLRPRPRLLSEPSRAVQLPREGSGAGRPAGRHRQAAEEIDSPRQLPSYEQIQKGHHITGTRWLTKYFTYKLKAKTQHGLRITSDPLNPEVSVKKVE